MRYDFSLEKGGAVALAVGAATALVLVFFAGVVTGAAAGAHAPELAMTLDSAALRDSAAAGSCGTSADSASTDSASSSSPAATTTAMLRLPGPTLAPYAAPRPGDSAAIAAALATPRDASVTVSARNAAWESAARDAAREEFDAPGEPVAVFDDETRALAMLQQIASHGGDAVIEAEPDDGGGVAFRVVLAGGARRRGAP
jgi:hypothetical protein